jgi:hypothetical protein
MARTAALFKSNSTQDYLPRMSASPPEEDIGLVSGEGPANDPKRTLQISFQLLNEGVHLDVNWEAIVAIAEVVGHCSIADLCCVAGAAKLRGF